MPGRPRFPLAFYVLAPPLAVLGTLAVLELGLRILHPVPVAAEFNLPFEADPVTGHRMRAEARGLFANGVAARTNAHGHRDDEAPRVPPPGRFRILLLGDSFSVGASVEQDAVYGQALERTLRERCGTDVEVVNAGTGGWDPFHYARYYEHEGHLFQPDLVLVGFFVGNDAYSRFRGPHNLLTAVMGRRVHPRATALGRHALRVQILLYERSHLARLFWNRGRLVLRPEDFPARAEPRDGGSFPPAYLRLQASRMVNHRKPNPSQTELARQAVEEIARIRDLARRAGAPLLVVLIPDENQVNAALRERIFSDPALLESIFPGRADVPGNPRAPFDFSMPQRLLEPLFARHGLATLDLLPEFLADSRRLYLNDSHWSAEGHALAARRLAASLAPRVPGCAE